MAAALPHIWARGLLDTAAVEAILVANSMMAVGVPRVLRDRPLIPGPYRLGTSRHGAPVRSSHKIPLSTCR